MARNHEISSELTRQPEFSKRQRTVFWFFLVLISMALCYGIAYSNIINWFPLLVVILIICMYSFSSIHQNKFSHPYAYLIPLFVALSLSFTMITVTIGMHGDTFITYDNDANSFYPNSYQPIEVKEIVKFPLQQLRYHNSPDSLTVNFSNLKDTMPTSNIIVIDKTSSIISADPAAKDSLLKEIREEYSFNYDEEAEYDVTDLLPPFFLSGLSKNKRYSSAKDEAYIYYYTGVENKFNGSFHLMQDDAVEDFKGFVKNYLNANKRYKQQLRYKNKNRETTSLSKMVRSLNSIISTSSFKGKQISVTIVSDFINSIPDEEIPDISRAHQISKLNLYILNGREGQSKNRNNVQNTISGLVSNFSVLHNHAIVNFKNVNFNNPTEAKKFVNELKTANMQVFDERGRKNVPVYYPYKDFLTNQEAVARISFKDDSGNDESEFMFSIKDVDNNTSSYPIVYRINSGVGVVTHFNELKAITLNKTDVLSLHFPYTLPYKNDRLFAEFVSTASNKITMQSLTVKPLLSKAMSFTLLGVYTIFVIALCLLLILPNMYVYYMISHELIHCQKGHALGLTLPLAVGFVSLTYFGIVMCKNDHWLLFSTVLFILLFATIPALIASFKKHVDDRTQLALQHTFHLFGSLAPDIVYLFIWRRPLS
ncbi:hypothetical protein [Mucilaginibacter auburnensis]|nr:hypothetical protein [Mucilaginibacter auburnensis]